MERIFATIFIVAFFSALPLWALSKQRGWVTLLGKREGPTGPFEVTVVRRNAFSSSSNVVTVAGADVRFIARPIGRRSPGDRLVFVLETPNDPRYEVVDDFARSVQFIPSIMAPMRAWADIINTARDTGQVSFTVEIPPEDAFWVVAGITVVFAAAGLVIAVMGGGSTPARG